MWYRVKWAMAKSAREICGSVRVGGKKSVWWNDEIKAAVRRNEAAWKGVLAGSDEETKIDVWKSTEKRREWLKGI